MNLNLSVNLIVAKSVESALQAGYATCEHMGSLCVIEYGVQWSSLTL
jgi:hypothetical protein